ncbi:MAG: hypothetical protein JW751_09510, partial [Polyangiaceae bacterium]|nr:hypothetical protein [Polyangiaceae bacterium]
VTDELSSELALTDEHALRDAWSLFHQLGLEGADTLKLLFPLCSTRVTGLERLDATPGLSLPLARDRDREVEAMPGQRAAGRDGARSRRVTGGVADPVRAGALPPARGVAEGPAVDLDPRRSRPCGHSDSWLTLPSQGRAEQGEGYDRDALRQRVRLPAGAHDPEVIEP